MFSARVCSYSLSRSDIMRQTPAKTGDGPYGLVPALILKFCKNLTGPCGAPPSLPTYLPYLWETRKEIMGRVKVGYYTN